MIRIFYPRVTNVMIVMVICIKDYINKFLYPTYDIANVGHRAILRVYTGKQISL